MKTDEMQSFPSQIKTRELFPFSELSHLIDISVSTYRTPQADISF